MVCWRGCSVVLVTSENPKAIFKLSPRAPAPTKHSFAPPPTQWPAECRPSLRQSSATTGAFSSVSVKRWSTALARSAKSSIAAYARPSLAVIRSAASGDGTLREGSRYACSPATRSDSRLVARVAIPGQLRKSALPTVSHLDEHVLAVVEDQQHRFVFEIGHQSLEQRMIRHFLQRQCGSDRCDDQRRIRRPARSQ